MRKISKKRQKQNKGILVSCIQCGKERFIAVQQRKSNKYTGLCADCSRKERRGNKSPVWKGGRYKQREGYILVKLETNNFFYPMVNKSGYVFEHRLVVAKALGRCLHSWEIIHHKHGFAKDDNQYPQTLQLVTDDRHMQITILENQINRLEAKVDEQAKQIRLLKWQGKHKIQIGQDFREKCQDETS